MAPEETIMGVRSSYAVIDEEEEYIEEERWELYRHLMSIQSSDDGGDADAELSDKEPASVTMHGGEEDDDDDSVTGFASVPGTPVRLRAGCAKEYASDAEASARRRRWRGRGGARRERMLDRAWEVKKSRAAEEEAAWEGECRVLVQRRGRAGCMPMDMEEVRACRDLGLELPDWTVEIPGWLSVSTVDTSSGGNSPVANCRISSPGGDPTDVKARLKAWAHAVALASTSGFSG